MTEYDEILKAIEQLPDMFGTTDILDAERVALNLAARREKMSENDHLSYLYQPYTGKCRK